MLISIGYLHHHQYYIVAVAAAVVVAVLVVVKECPWTPLKAYREKGSSAPAVLRRRKFPWYPFSRVLSGPHGWSGCCEVEKKSSGSAGNQTVQPQYNNNNNNNNNLNTNINLKCI